MAIHSVERGHYRMLGLVVPALLLDGLDVKLLSLAAPLILAEWQISKSEMGPAMAAALIGMAFGASLGGWLGDRLGRRTLIVLSTVTFAMTTLAVAWVNGLISLAALRFISGLGFGALMPNVYALCTEWLPRRASDRAMSVLTVLTPVGGALGAVLALWMLPAYGWRGSFLLCGGVGLATVLAMILWLPESVRFLLARGKTAQALRTWRSVMGRASDLPVADDEEAATAIKPGLVQTAPESSGGSRQGIFTRDYLLLLIGSCVVCFSCQFVNYAVAGWLPVIATMAGLTLQKGISAVAVFNVFSVLWSLIIINLNTRMGVRMLLPMTLIGGIVCLLALANLLQADMAAGGPSQLLIFYGVIALLGACSGGLVSLMAALVTAAYPPDRRASGVGFTVMAGRLGGIIAMVTGGVLLDLRPDNPAPIFYVLTVFLFFALYGARLIDRHGRGGRQGGPVAATATAAPAHLASDR